MTMSTDRAMALAGASLFSFVLAAGALTGCSKQPAPAPATQNDPNARVDAYADVLGVIVQLPVEGNPSTAFKIYHEHIPSFKTRDGTVFVNAEGVPGMRAMEMPFPVKEPVSIDGLAIGDKVRFSFAVNYGGGGTAWHLTAIETIDPDTEIDYANKVVIEPDSDDDHSDHDGHDHSGHDHSHDGP